MWKLALMTVLVAVAALAVACGDDDDSDEVSVCDQKVEVEDSVRALTDPDLVTSGTDEINAAVENVRTDLSGLREAVSADIEPEVEALETAVDDAQDTLSNLDDASLNERIDAVQAAVTGVATAAADLTTALDSEC